MHDHNLDDLIIDNIEPKNSKTKSFLTIIALLIVVMIVAIILTKILLKTPTNTDLAFEEDVSEMIAPELKLKERAKKPETIQEPTMSRIIENEPNAPAAETSKFAKEENTESKTAGSDKELELSNISEEAIKSPSAEMTAASKEERDAADIAYWESVQEKRRAEKISNEEKTEAPVKKAAQPTKHVESKKVPVPSKPKPTVKQEAFKSEPKAISTENYYIQVGAYRQNPDPRFMSVIRNNAYQYSVTKPGTNGLKKILIGPYKDSASATRALKEIRDRINKRAFIVKR